MSFNKMSKDTKISNKFKEVMSKYIQVRMELAVSKGLFSGLKRLKASSEKSHQKGLAKMESQLIGSYRRIKRRLMRIVHDVDTEK